MLFIFEVLIMTGFR